ncbi:MAG TPA: kelch repeat-containing protein [Candidatus Thermoplasmatota archaeon]|nr:kelch repeat-containing protein [Candidatus Thermoplasmatota archaeon]
MVPRPAGRLRPLGLAAILLLVALPVLAPFAEGARASTEHMLPTARLGAAAVQANGFIYLIGGRTGHTSYLDEIVKFDPATGKSEVVARLPPSTAGPAGRQSASAVYSGSKIYVFGGAVIVTATFPDGSQGPVPQSLPDIVEWDPQNPSQAPTLLVDRLPRPVWGTGAAYYNGKAYVFGGFQFDIKKPTDIGRNDEIYEFSPAKSVGSRVVKAPGALPYPLQDAGVAVAGPYAYLFGGLATLTREPDAESGASTQSTVVDTIIRVYLPTTDAENLTATKPKARLPARLQYHSAALVPDTKDMIYVFGGRQADGTPTAAIHAFDPSSHEAFALPFTLPGARFAAAAAEVGGNVYVLGGRDTASHENGMRDIVKFVAGATEPGAPRDVRADAGETILVSWSPPFYDGGAPITGYKAYRIDPSGNTTLLATLSAGALTHRDTPPAKGVLYTYRVTATNEKGESRAGGEVQIRSPTTPPSAPRAVAVFPSDRALLVRWEPPADDGGLPIAAYRIYRDVADASGRPHATCPGDASGGCIENGFRDAGLVNGVNHTYRVVAVNSRGPSPASEAATGSAAATPPAPTRLAATVAGTSVFLTWDAVDRPGVSYHVHRGVDGAAPARIATVHDPAYTDERLERGRVYRYYVRAADQAGAGPPSNVAEAPLFERPTAPRNLVANASGGVVRLTWDPPVSGGGAPAVQYLVKREAPGAEAAYVASGLTATSWEDANVVAGLTYRYFVEAANAAGKSAAAGPASAAPGAVANARPTASLTATAATLRVAEKITFDASYSTDADGRVVEYAFDFGDGVTTGWVKTPTVEHTYATNGSYTAKLVVRDDRGAESERAASWNLVVGAVKRDENTDNPRPPVDDRPGVEAGRLPHPGIAMLVLVLFGAARALKRRRD